MQYKYMVLLSSLIFSLYEPVGLDTCVVCVYLFMWLCAQIHVGVAACRGQRLEACLYLSTLCMFIFLDKGSHWTWTSLISSVSEPADEFRDLPLCRSRLPALGLQMSHICLASYSSWGSELCAHRTGSWLTKPSRGPHAYLWCWHLHLVIPVFLNDPLLFFFHSFLSIHLYMREYII